MIELDGHRRTNPAWARTRSWESPCAAARAMAAALGHRCGAGCSGSRKARPFRLPMVNIISGGLHAGRNLEFQDFLAVPHGLPGYSEALRAVVGIHRATRELLEDGGYLLTGVADEGGWGPRLPTNEAALEMLTRAIEKVGFAPGGEVSIAIDVAASHSYSGGRYELRSRGAPARQRGDDRAALAIGRAGSRSARSRTGWRKTIGRAGVC